MQGNGINISLLQFK